MRIAHDGTQSSLNGATAEWSTVRVRRKRRSNIARPIIDVTTLTHHVHADGGKPPMNVATPVPMEPGSYKVQATQQVC